MEKTVTCITLPPNIEKNITPNVILTNVLYNSFFQEKANGNLPDEITIKDYLENENVPKLDDTKPEHFFEFTTCGIYFNIIMK